MRGVRERGGEVHRFLAGATGCMEVSFTEMGM